MKRRAVPSTEDIPSEVELDEGQASLPSLSCIVLAMYLTFKKAKSTGAVAGAL